MKSAKHPLHRRSQAVEGDGAQAPRPQSGPSGAHFRKLEKVAGWVKLLPSAWLVEAKASLVTKLPQEPKA